MLATSHAAAPSAPAPTRSPARFALIQVGSALVIYGKIPRVSAPSWIGGLHRWSGRIAFLVANAPTCQAGDMHSTPAFAADPATAAYYDQRAAEYDEWYAGTGIFAQRKRPGWHDEVGQVTTLAAGLPPARTLDVACGTGFLTRHLRGLVAGVDQSPAMVAIARSRLTGGRAIVGDALRIPVAGRAFDRLFTGHFYGHLAAAERQAFLAEARRVADELVVVDSALRPGVDPEQWQERVLNDGSRHRVYKRYFAAGQLAAEPLLDGTWFVATGVMVIAALTTGRPAKGARAGVLMGIDSAIRALRGRPGDAVMCSLSTASPGRPRLSIVVVGPAMSLKLEVLQRRRAGDAVRRCRGGLAGAARSQS